MATATGILWRGNVCNTSASDDGTSAAAATACRIRAPTRKATVGATPQSIDARVKPTAAVRNVRRRPTRSASRPNGIRSAAKTIVYALRIHDSEDGELDENWALIEGKATKRIVVSRNTAKTARLVLPSTTHGLRSGFVSGGGLGLAVSCIADSSVSDGIK